MLSEQFNPQPLLSVLWEQCLLRKLFPCQSALSCTVRRRLGLGLGRLSGAGRHIPIYMDMGPGMACPTWACAGAVGSPPRRPGIGKKLRGGLGGPGSVFGGSVLVLGCARLLTLTLGTACNTLTLHARTYTDRCVYTHIYCPDLPPDAHTPH